MRQHNSQLRPLGRVSLVCSSILSGSSATTKKSQKTVQAHWSDPCPHNYILTSTRSKRLLLPTLCFLIIAELSKDSRNSRITSMGTTVYALHVQQAVQSTESWGVKRRSRYTVSPMFSCSSLSQSPPLNHKRKHKPCISSLLLEPAQCRRRDPRLAP